MEVGLAPRIPLQDAVGIVASELTVGESEVGIVGAANGFCSVNPCRYGYAHEIVGAGVGLLAVTCGIVLLADAVVKVAVAGLVQHHAHVLVMLLALAGGGCSCRQAS